MNTTKWILAGAFPADPNVDGPQVCAIRTDDVAEHLDRMAVVAGLQREHENLTTVEFAGYGAALFWHSLANIEGVLDDAPSGRADEVEKIVSGLADRTLLATLPELPVGDAIPVDYVVLRYTEHTLTVLAGARRVYVGEFRSADFERRALEALSVGGARIYTGEGKEELR